MAATTFEDLPVGARLRIGRYELDSEEIIAFASRWDPQPFHIDEAAARHSIFGGLTASSLHLFAICTRLFFDFEPRVAVLAMLGKDVVRFPNPARAGDVLVYDTECVEQRASRSKADRGVITLADTLANEGGEPVLTQRVALMVARRGA